MLNKIKNKKAPFIIQNLKDSQVLEFVKKEYQNVVNFGRQKEGYQLAVQIEKGLKENNLEKENLDLYNQYQNILVKLKWFTLSWLPQNELISLFKNDFIKIFEVENFNIWEKLREKLFTITIFENRDELKQKIQQALLTNQEQITSQKLLTGEPSIIANWLKDYISKLGNNPVDKTKQTEYLINSENVKNLTPDEKDKLKILFNLFEKTKLSSFTLEGIEEAIPVDESGNEGEIIEGRFIKYRGKEKIISDLKEMQAIIEGKPQSSQSIITQSFTNLAQITQNIVKTANLNLPDPILQKRLENLIMSYLKEIRNLTQVQEMLSRHQKIGGLELSKEQSQKVINILKLEKRKLEESRRIKGEKPATNLEKLIQGEAGTSFISKEPTKPLQLQASKPLTPLPSASNGRSGQARRQTTQSPEKQEGPDTNIKPPILSSVSQPASQLASQSVPIGLISRPKEIKIEPPQPKSQPPVPPKPVLTPIKIQEIKPPAPKIPSRPTQTFKSPLYTTNLPVPPVSKKPPSSFARPQLESIRQPSRLVGGVEEIDSLRLADFRRWSTEPKESAARIKDKIDALEEQSIEKKAQAISAWQNSEINRLYLDIGRESMETQNPVEVTIKQRQAENKPTLSLAEFEAIADLNQELNF